MQLINNLYNYRELLKSNVKKEIRGKYKGSILGILWSFVNPLLMVLVYAIVFPYIMRVKTDNYLVYLITAIIPWNYFTTAINQGMITVRMNAGIIKKVYFPREILPISVVTSGLVNFFISCIIILIFCIFSGVGLSFHLLLLPFIALIHIKDTEYIIQFFLNMLFYATPILYPATMFPKTIRWVLYINPMSQLIDAYRNIFLYHEMPNVLGIVYIIIVTTIIFVIGLAIFRKLEKGFAEEI